MLINESSPLILRGVTGHINARLSEVVLHIGDKQHDLAISRSVGNHGYPSILYTLDGSTPASGDYEIYRCMTFRKKENE